MHRHVVFTSALITTTLTIVTLLSVQRGALAQSGVAVQSRTDTRTTSGAAYQAAGAGPAGTSSIALGINASLGGRRAMAGDSAWNVPIDHLPADPASDKIIGTIGADIPLHPDFGTTYAGAPWGIPYVIVPGDTPRFPVVFDYADESDDVLYPIPPNPPIEGVPAGKTPAGDGDHHIVMIDRDNLRLYELYAVRFKDGRWHAGSGAVWDLFGDTKRPRGWTSADAAGLAIFPGLVRYEEMVELGRIEHALRFTVPKSRRAYVAPATHAASRDSNASLPPMGLRVRLKASVDANAFPPHVRPLIVALKKYGMILADNGGPFYVSGAPDPRWNDADIETLKRIKGRDFEVVQMGTVVEP